MKKGIVKDMVPYLKEGMLVRIDYKKETFDYVDGIIGEIRDNVFFI